MVYYKVHCLQLFIHCADSNYKYFTKMSLGIVFVYRSLEISSQETYLFIKSDIRRLPLSVLWYRLPWNDIIDTSYCLFSTFSRSNAELMYISTTNVIFRICKVWVNNALVLSNYITFCYFPYDTLVSVICYKVSTLYVLFYLSTKCLSWAIGWHFVRFPSVSRQRLL